MTTPSRPAVSSRCARAGSRPGDRGRLPRKSGGRGQEGLTIGQGVEKCGGPLGIELGEHVVEQQDRCRADAFGRETVRRQSQGERERPLLALGGMRAQPGDRSGRSRARHGAGPTRVTPRRSSSSRAAPSARTQSGRAPRSVVAEADGHRRSRSVGRGNLDDRRGPHGARGRPRVGVPEVGERLTRGRRLVVPHVEGQQRRLVGPACASASAGRCAASTPAPSSERIASFRGWMVTSSVVEELAARPGPPLTRSEVVGREDRGRDGVVQVTASGPGAAGSPCTPVATDRARSRPRSGSPGRHARARPARSPARRPDAHQRLARCTSERTQATRGSRPPRAGSSCRCRCARSTAQSPARQLQFDRWVGAEIGQPEVPSHRVAGTGSGARGPACSRYRKSCVSPRTQHRGTVGVLGLQLDLVADRHVEAVHQVVRVERHGQLARRRTWRRVARRPDRARCRSPGARGRPRSSSAGAVCSPSSSASPGERRPGTPGGPRSGCSADSSGMSFWYFGKSSGISRVVMWKLADAERRRIVSDTVERSASVSSVNSRLNSLSARDGTSIRWPSASAGGAREALAVRAGRSRWTPCACPPSSAASRTPVRITERVSSVDAARDHLAKSLGELVAGEGDGLAHGFGQVAGTRRRGSR